MRKLVVFYSHSAEYYEIKMLVAYLLKYIIWNSLTSYLGPISKIVKRRKNDTFVSFL